MSTVRMVHAGLLMWLLPACGDRSLPVAVEDPEAAVRIVGVEANQGAAVAVVAGGDLVPEGSRNAPLIARRQTLLRPVLEVGTSWRSRPLRAVLELAAPGAAPSVHVRTVLVASGGKGLEHPDSGAAWKIPPGEAVPGTTFRISLTELDGTPLGPAAMAPPLPALVGFLDSHQVIRVTVVPVRHDFPESCGEVPTLSAADLETLGELLHRRNPTERVVMALREPYVWTESLSTYTGLLTALAQLRFEDDADPAQYYAGLVHQCVRTGGQAIDRPAFPTRENGWTRTTVSAWRGNAAYTSSTFVHELGHAQGRSHVRCTGMEGGPDPDYPYPDGNIGVWGYNIELPDARLAYLSGRIYDPVTTYDYMGYCTGQHHVSDYGWRKVYPFIAEVSSWELADGAAPALRAAPERQLLVAAIDPDGAAHWFTVPGSAADRPSSPGWSVEVTVDGAVTKLPAAVSVVESSGVTNVVVELPGPLDGVEDLTLRSGTVRWRVDPAAVRRAASGPSASTRPVVLSGWGVEAGG